MWTWFVAGSGLVVLLRTSFDDAAVGVENSPSNFNKEAAQRSASLSSSSAFSYSGVDSSPSHISSSNPNRLAADRIVRKIDPPIII